jgi:hypothetical protein
VRPAEQIHPHLPPLRLINRRTAEYVGACPFCGGDADSDRFHVWMAVSGGRPARRFWCRSCDAKGLLDARFGVEEPDRIAAARQRAATRHKPTPAGALARPDHIPQYRQVYALVAL